MPKSKPLILLIFVCLLVGLFLLPVRVSAGLLSQSFVRLDRLQSHTTTGGVICAQPGTNGVESSVAITFPPSYSVNTNHSNWTVSTSDIPSGSTAWPGIGTATSVFGQTVTFPSGDLGLGVLYCFDFSGTNTLTNPASGADLNGTLSTNLDASTVAFSSSSNDQLSVTATVPANSSDFSSAIISPTKGQPFSQGTTADYSLTYGSNLAYNSNITIEAEWSQGTVSGSNIPSVDLLDYVIGSASNGYGNVSPVVDPVNRKIDWVITNLPANTHNQTVTFQLKTNSSYTGSSLVNFAVSSRVIGPGVITPDQTVNQSYLYLAPASSGGSSSSASSSPTPTPSPTPSVSPSPSATPAPQTAFAINAVKVQELTQSNATLEVDTSSASNVIVKYSSSTKSLDQSLSDSAFQTSHQIRLDGLNPDTFYYFKVSATSSDGKTAQSDIFVFKTAQVSIAPTLNQQSLVVTSTEDIPLNENPTTPDAKTVSGLVIPQDNVYAFKFTVAKPDQVRSISIIVKNSQVLGVSTDDIGAVNTVESTVTEIQPGSYYGRLKTPSTPGKYEADLKITDYQGNIVNQKLFDLTVVKPLTVLSQSGSAIEHARLLIELFNQRLKIFEEVSPQSLPIDNPSYTDYQGIDNLTLPQATYRITVTALGYKEKTVQFEIGSGQNSGYPEIRLDKDTNIANFTKYYARTGLDLYSGSVGLVTGLAKSSRLFSLFTLMAMVCLIFVTFLAFIYRTHSSFKDLPKHVIYHLLHIFKRNSARAYFIGKVLDSESDRPLSLVQVMLLNKNTNSVIAQTRTNKLGKFIFNNPGSASYKLLIVKNGFEPLVGVEEINLDEELTIFKLAKQTQPNSSIVQYLKLMLERGLSFSFEIWLTASIFFELFFASALGLLKVLPIIIATVLTILFWASYLRDSRLELRSA